MPVSPTNKRPEGTNLLRPLALGLLLAAAGSAAAQWLPQRPPGDDPWYVGASQTFTRDSNVFRSNDLDTTPPEVSDTISSTSLLGGVNLRLGRQRVLADALVSRNNYRDTDVLDHTAYRAGLRLDWETIARLSGEVALRTRKDLVLRDEVSGIGAEQRTMRKVDSASVTGRLGATSLLTLEARLGHQRADYGAASALDHDQNFASLGLLYRPSGALTLGAAARFTKGEYPNLVIGGVPVVDEFDRRDLDFTARWEPTGISTVRARLSATETDHDVVARDVSGVTGALEWDWRPTGKLRFISELSRDTGTQSTFQEFTDPFTDQTITATGATTRVVNLVRVRALWEATAKVRLDGELRHQQRSFAGQLASDRSTGVSLGVRYDPIRTVGLGCSVGRDSRSSSADAREYDVNLASCFAQFVMH